MLTSLPVAGGETFSEKRQKNGVGWTQNVSVIRVSLLSPLKSKKITHCLEDTKKVVTPYRNEAVKVIIFRTPEHGFFEAPEGVLFALTWAGNFVVFENWASLRDN